MVQGWGILKGLTSAVLQNRPRSRSFRNFFSGRRQTGKLPTAGIYSGKALPSARKRFLLPPTCGPRPRIRWGEYARLVAQCSKGLGQIVQAEVGPAHCVQVYSDLVQQWIQSKHTLRYTGGMVPDIHHIITKVSSSFLQ
jgi:hypothetical protein